MATKIQVRRDTAANWTANDPTLSDGEIGFETDSGKFKIGNGSSVWSALDYFLDSSDLLAYLTAASASTTYLTQASASTTYATKVELNNIDLSSASAAAVAAIVDSAPATLDTLNELAAALGDDANFASTVTTALGNKIDTSTASSTYLTQASASTTYLTQASASATYATIGSGGGASITKRFIAIGPAGSFYISSNGYDWTTTPAPTLPSVTGTWNCVHYANGIFVATGGGDSTTSPQVIYTSPNGIDWTYRFEEPGNVGASPIRNIVYGNGIWVAQEAAGFRKIYYSTDNGVTWTKISSPGGNHLEITYGNGNFLLVGYNMAKKSTNGSTWTDITLPITDVQWGSCAYSNGLYFIFQDNSTTYLTSPDLINWTSRTHSTSAGNAKVCNAQTDILVTVIFNHNAVFGTHNGINWKQFGVSQLYPGMGDSGNQIAETSFRKLVYGDGKFIAGSAASNSIVMSEDPTRWVWRRLPGISFIRSMAYGEF
jgi:hypothetical protein